MSRKALENRCHPKKSNAKKKKSTVSQATFEIQISGTMPKSSVFEGMTCTVGITNLDFAIDYQSALADILQDRETTQCSDRDAVEEEVVGSLRERTIWKKRLFYKVKGKALEFHTEHFLLFVQKRNQV
jgi:hypothetical protein